MIKYEDDEACAKTGQEDDDYDNANYRKTKKEEESGKQTYDEGQCRSKAETCCHGKSVEVGQVDSCMFRSTLSH